MNPGAAPGGDTRRQLLRFGVIGLLSNATLYAAYLLLDRLGAGHKTAMSLVYCGGVLLTFLLNRRWTFNHGGAVHSTLARYAASYALVYVFNLAAMLLLVDRAHLPHRWVMLGLIVCCAGLTFLLQKFWVFAAARRLASG